MRLLVGLLALLLPLPLRAASWEELLARAAGERKPLVTFLRTTGCERCDEFETETLAHPAIRRRLPSVVFGAMPAPPEASAPAIVLFDRRGVERARWPLVPDTTSFGVILDSIEAVAPQLERAAAISEAEGEAAGEVEAALALAGLGRSGAARAALQKASAANDPSTRQRAAIAGALLDLEEAQWARARAALDQVAQSPETAAIATDAWMALGALHHRVGEVDRSVLAFERAAGQAPPESAARAAALKAAAELRAGSAEPPPPDPVLRILAMDRQVVTGRQRVRTQVSSAEVERVVFSLDGVRAAEVSRPPFQTVLDFGAVPERHTVRAVAFGERGREIGRDELTLNDAGETFWVRILEPRDAAAGGAVRVTLSVRLPATMASSRVVITWNEAIRARLSAPPWSAALAIPPGETGILRAVVELADGRSSEDAVLLNASGAIDRADVQLVGLPLTILTGGDAPPEVEPSRIRVQEGPKRRPVEAVAAAAETPLTVGLVIDASASMQRTLPDVQEAAIRFLETMLGPQDRAFLIAFATSAQLVQPATADVDLLRRRIMQLRPEGSTALHDAIALGLLQFEGVKGRRALVVLTDGVDRSSRTSLADVRDFARRTSVPVHVISVRLDTPAGGTGSPAGSRFGDTLEWVVAFRDLAMLAAASGGTAHSLERLEQLPRLYARIEAALRAQYLVFIRTDPATTGHEWRPVEVTVAIDGAEVIAPEGYAASW